MPLNNIAYLRSIVGGPSWSKEFVNGCPSLTIDAEPSLVVRLLPTGKLEQFTHYRLTQVM